MKGLWCSALAALRGRSDEEAMERVRTRGDHEEFARLVKRWEEPIQRLCTRMTGDPERGEDLKQETFLRLFRHRRNYQPAARFSTFLWRIAINLCYDELRRQQRRHEFPHPALDQDNAGGELDAVLAEAASEAPGPDTRAVQSEESQLVREAVLQLPEIYRVVILLRHYEGLKLGRIAEILEIPEGTVNSRLAEALTRLARSLEPKFVPRAVAPAPPNAIPNLKEPVVL